MGKKSKAIMVKTNVKFELECYETYEGICYLSCNYKMIWGEYKNKILKLSKR